MNKTYLTASLRAIKTSLGRFIAIVLIIFLGVLLFVGIKSVGPDLQQTLRQMFDVQKVSDVQLLSTVGFDKKDVTKLEKLKGSKISASYSIPYFEEKKQLNLKLYSYQADMPNKLTLVKGNWLDKDTDVLVDQKLAKDYPLGSQIFLEKTLKHTKYRVVGYVTSPLYLSLEERGTTTTGDGQLDGYLYLKQNQFVGLPYSLIDITFNDLIDVDYFSNAYNTTLDAQITTLKKQLNMLKTQKIKRLQQQKQTLLAKQAKIDQQQEFAQSTAQAQQLQQAKREIQAKLSQVQQASQINYVLSKRSDWPGLVEYTSLSDRIDAIANVFPIFFFFIAVLITFTTMTRMIEENRKEIGTLKALGYRNAEIASKYLLYAVLTALFGIITGVVVGTYFIPSIICMLLKKQYIFADYNILYWSTPIILATLGALIATLGSCSYVLLKELHEKPVELLLPRAPKAGKRVWLEKSTLWQRLSFNQKVTYRNLFRYKARMFLTIFGIAGCSGLLLAGFGLNDSLPAPIHKQFGEIMHYQMIATQNISQKVIFNNHEITDALAIDLFQANIKRKNKDTQTSSVYLFDQKGQQNLAKFITLKDLQNHSIKLDDRGAIVSQQLAQSLDLQPGDKFNLEVDGKTYRIKVAHITQNYVAHNIYLAKEYAEKCGLVSVNNSYLLKTKKLNSKQEEKLAQKLLDSKNFISVNLVSEQIAKQKKTTDNLGIVVLIFILLSGTLAFVVLYNLTNINIAERQRELATFKVLGFYDREVTGYIVRENIIFTLGGIVLGFLIGNILTWFILQNASSAMILFPLIIKWPDYAYATVLTIIFSIIVMYFADRKLKEIKMIEALNSNE